MGLDRKRPLSPHLQIYRPQITSILSIMHRLTGVMLVFGTCLMFYWLTAATLGLSAYTIAQDVLSSWIGILAMFGVIFSVWYHLFNGIRHLFWDIGLGFELVTVRITGTLVLFFATLMTIGTYIVYFFLVGNP